jgi:hypothetical protein
LMGESGEVSVASGLAALRREAVSEKRGWVLTRVVL